MRYQVEQCISGALAQVSQDVVVTEVVSLLIVKSKSVAIAPPVLRGLAVPSEFRIVCVINITNNINNENRASTTIA